MNQILTLLNLYSEFIALFAVASLLSLFVGWMIGRSSARKRMNAASASWEERYKTLEETSAADAENLEEQLQEIAAEARTLKASNRVLSESLKKNDSTIQKVRAESIELNRQHAETQERLQRIIQQKERVNTELPVGKAGASTSARSGSTYTAPIDTNQSVGSLGSVFLEDIDDELEDTLLDHPAPADIHRQPVAHVAQEASRDPAPLSSNTIATHPADAMDATVQMSADDYIHQKKQQERAESSNELIEDTADVTTSMMEELEESTVVLDEDSIEFAKRPFPLSNVD